MDIPVANQQVSVWADPDIGEGTFFVIFESSEQQTLSEIPKVSMWVEPVNGRLDRATYDAIRQSVKGRTQFQAKPRFDQRDTWNVGFNIEFAGRAPDELVAQVESTPPGFGPWGLLIYFLPFALVGALWIAAMLKMRQRRQEALRSVRTVEAVLQA
jgi:hypothetical protein